MAKFFEMLTPGAIRKNVLLLANHRHFKKSINLRNRSPSEFYVQDIPDSDFEKEVSWCLGIVELFKDDVTKAIDLERELLPYLFACEWSVVTDKICALEASAGISMWSLALRGAILTAQGKSDEKRQLLTRLNQDAKDNRFFKSVLYLKMNRQDEADILSGQSRFFEQKIKRMFVGETLHFLMYKVVQHSFDFDLDFSKVISVEKNSCPIDIFNVLQDLVLYSRFSEGELAFPAIVKLAASTLARSYGSTSARALALAYGSSTSFTLSRQAYDVLDLYTAGEYSRVCSYMEANSDAVMHFTLFETWAKSASRTDSFPNGYLGSLLRSSVSILRKDSEHDVSRAFLLAQCESFGGLAWYRELHFFVIRETTFLTPARNSALQWISWAISGLDTPLKIAVFPEATRTAFMEELSKLRDSHLVVRFIETAFTGPQRLRDFPREADRCRSAKYFAIALAQTGAVRRAIKLLRPLTRSNDPLVANDASRELVRILLQNGDLEEAITRYVASVMANPPLLKTYDNKAIADACEQLVGTSLSIAIPIALSLYSRFIDDAHDATLRYAFESFLSASKIVRPEEIVSVGGLTDQMTNYFLEFVATPAVMKLYLQFDTVRDIEDCRISVCRLLLDRQHNVEAMIREVKDRTRQLVIAAGAKHIESSRIYADTTCFSDTASSAPYRQLYDRFMYLRRNDYSAYTDEIELQALVIRFADKPAIAENSYKIHVQSVVLNEKNATFLQLVKLMRDEFTFGVRGLSGYLSTRIRHGHLPNLLRRSVSDEDLICSRNLATGTHRDDSRWCLGIIPSLPSSKATELARVFNEFSSKIDSLIDELNDQWLQIFTVDQDISGLTTAPALQKNLFNYSVTALETYYLQKQISDSSDFLDFCKVIVGWLWLRTEHNLEKIRSKLAEDVRTRAIAALDQLSTSIGLIAGEVMELSEFTDAVNRGRLALNLSLDTIQAWFVKSRGSTPASFESDIAVEIARLSCQVNVRSHRDDTGIIFQGAYLSYFVDFLFVLLDNCLSKSGLDDSVWVETAFYIESDQLKISVTNNCLMVGDMEFSNSALSFYREHYGKESYAIRASQGEGGSGFFKVWKALQKDLNLPHQIVFGYVAPSTFQVEIAIAISDLYKVQFREDTLG